MEIHLSTNSLLPNAVLGRFKTKQLFLVQINNLGNIFGSTYFIRAIQFFRNVVLCAQHLNVLLIQDDIDVVVVMAFIAK